MAKKRHLVHISAENVAVVVLLFVYFIRGQTEIEHKHRLFAQ